MSEVTETPSGGFSWRGLFSFASLGAALVLALVTVLIFKEAEPPFIVMFVLFLVGGILARRTGKLGVVGIVLATLAAVMFTVFAGPFAAAVIGLPVAKDEFIPALSLLTLALTVLISALVLAGARPWPGIRCLPRSKRDSGGSDDPGVGDRRLEPVRRI